MSDTTATHRRAQLALVVLLAGALAIAFSPIFVRLSELGPVATAFWRIAAALPAFAVWRLIESRQPRATETGTPSRNRLMLALAGAFFACDLAAWHWSIKLTSVANATLLSNLTPLFVTPVAWLLFRERIRPLFVGGMLLSVGGAVLLMGQSFNLSADYLLGDALGILTAVFYGGYQLTVSRLRIGSSTATIMLWSGVAAALLLWPMAAVSGEGFIAATSYGWAVLLGLALFSHAGGQSMIAYAFAHLPASFSSVALLLQPAAAAVLAWVILAEPLGWLQGLGGVVILAGIFMARQGSQS